MSLAQQVVTLVGAIGKKFVDVPVEKIKDYQSRMLEYFDTEHNDIMSEIESTKILDDDLRESILTAIDSFAEVNNG